MTEWIAKSALLLAPELSEVAWLASCDLYDFNEAPESEPRGDGPRKP